MNTGNQNLNIFNMTCMRKDIIMVVLEIYMVHIDFLI